MPPPWHSVPALHDNDLPQASRSTCRHDGAAGGTVLVRRKDCCRRNDSTLRQRKKRIGRGNVAAKTAVGGPFYLRARRCRRNCSSLLRRLLQAELIYFAATKIRIGRGNVAATTSQADHFTCRHDGAAVIPKFTPQIKNQCTQEGVSRQNHAVIPKFTP